MAEAGFPLHTLPVGGLRGKSLRTRLSGLLNMGRSVFRAIGVLRHMRPDVVLGMGGYAAAPGGLAAWMLRTPLVIHEQNARPGKTNLYLSRLATRVLEAFPGAIPNAGGVELVGNPVRASLIEAAAGQHWPMDIPPRILVLGGSLGAAALNEVVPRALARLNAARPIRVLHQAGDGKAEACLSVYREVGLDAEVVPFITDMATAYSQSVLVICRAGAMTLSELMVMGRPALLVPFPHAVDDHQFYNARYLADAGAARILRQNELSARRLAEELEALLADPCQLEAMGNCARTLARPESAERIADILEATGHA
ncbi:MAG: undecaprenyldiphospho-muramoylpentapeptide beta-N-acetylglucosaminyltransferase [Gammaproteobacteria bacterium]|nr:MAG: undecaprenyldiphospho-muramoylpentapeptide beta-N-acetylglucosaminyltransferase [Gammaproteobacteria bacterium]